MARCRVQPRQGKRSTFVLVGNTRAGGIIPLLDGDNILEMARKSVGDGMTSQGGGGDYEKQAVVSTIITPCHSVLLKAARDVLVRSPGKTLVKAHAEQHLRVGDVVNLGTAGPRGSFHCLVSYTLQRAAAAAAAEAATVEVLDDSSDDGKGAAPAPPKRGRRSRERGSFCGCSASGGGDAAPSPSHVDVVDLCGLFDDDPPPADAEAPKRHRTNSCGGSDGSPVGVLDLCDSEDELAKTRAAPPAPAALDASSGGGGGGGGIPSGADEPSSPSTHPGSEQRPPPPPPPPTIDVASPPRGGPRSEPLAAPVQLAAVDADLSMRDLALPARIEIDHPPDFLEEPQAVEAASTSSLPSCSPAPLPLRRRPLEPILMQKPTPAGEKPKRRNISPPPRRAPPKSPAWAEKQAVSEDTETVGEASPPTSPPPTRKGSAIVAQSRATTGGRCGGGDGSLGDGVAAADAAAVGWRASDVGGGSAPGPTAEPPRPTTRQALTHMNDDFRHRLGWHIREDPLETISVVDELIARGTALPSSLCENVVFALLKSRCRVRNECLRRQLDAMLDVDPACWEPPSDVAIRINARGPSRHKQLFLSDWFKAVVEGACTDPASDGDLEPMEMAARREAHTIVLGVVVRYLSAVRCRHRRHCDSEYSDKDSNDINTPLPLLQEGQQQQQQPACTRVRSSLRRRVMQFFPQTTVDAGEPEPGKEGEETPETAPMKKNVTAAQARKNAVCTRQDAELAVETTAAWAMAMWSSAAAAAAAGLDEDGAGAVPVPATGVGAAGAGAGAGARAPQHGRWQWRRQRRQQRRRRQVQTSLALVRARHLVARLLEEVVEACGLPVSASCVAIVGQMNSFAGSPATAAAAGGGASGPSPAPEVAALAPREGCPGLAAADRRGLVLALFGRPFCVELARAMRNDLGESGEDVRRGDVAEVGRLRALLSRVCNHAQGVSDANALLLR